jgi:hypothetical protein
MWKKPEYGLGRGTLTTCGGDERGAKVLESNPD